MTVTPSPTPSATGPLAGVRVLDLTSVVMGPFATQILGDLGADVITVEPLDGEVMRGVGAGVHPQLSGVALNLLRNKRNVRVDLKSDAGRDAILRLAATCDVVVTNLRPGPLARLRLTYQDVRAVSPDIIFCQAQGFASDSPRADEVAYDDTIQASAGIADVMHKLTGEPALVPMIMADKVCGLTVVYAVSAALFHRARTGQGQHIEVPMHDTTVAFVLVEHGGGAIQQPPQGAPGYERLLTPHRRPYASRDGFVSILPYNKRSWVDLLSLGSATAPENDPRLANAASRTEHYDALYAELAPIVKTRTTAQWRAWCQAHRIASSEVATLEELVDGLPTAMHPISGPHKTIPPPVKFSASPQSLHRPAPCAGEHNEEVFGEVGLTREEIDAL